MKKPKGKNSRASNKGKDNSKEEEQEEEEEEGENGELNNSSEREDEKQDEEDNEEKLEEKDEDGEEDNTEATEQNEENPTRADDSMEKEESNDTPLDHFDRLRQRHKQQWDVQYQRLLEWQKESGLVVPELKEDVKLYKWVNLQQSLARRSKLPEDRIEKMKQCGVFDDLVTAVSVSSIMRGDVDFYQGVNWRR